MAVVVLRRGEREQYRPAAPYALRSDRLFANFVEDAFPKNHIPEAGPASFGGLLERVVKQHRRKYLDDLKQRRTRRPAPPCLR